MAYNTDSMFSNRKPVQVGPLMRELDIWSVSAIPKFEGTSFDGRIITQRDVGDVAIVTGSLDLGVVSSRKRGTREEPEFQVICDSCFRKNTFLSKTIVWSEHIKMSMNHPLSQAVLRASYPDVKTFVPIMPNYGIFEPVEFHLLEGGYVEMFSDIGEIITVFPVGLLTLGELRLMLADYMQYQLRDVRYTASNIQGVRVPDFADKFYEKHYQMNYQEARAMPTMDDQTQVPF